MTSGLSVSAKAVYNLFHTFWKDVPGSNRIESKESQLVTLELNEATTKLLQWGCEKKKQQRKKNKDKKENIFTLVRVVLLIHLGCVGVSCSLLEKSAVEILAFSQI